MSDTLKKKIIASLEFTTKDGEQQVKKAAQNIIASIENIGKASDKIKYFKPLVEDISDVDDMLDDFKNKFGENMLNEMLGHINPNIEKALKSHLNLTREQLVAVDELYGKKSKLQQTLDAVDNKPIKIDTTEANDVQIITGLIEEYKTATEKWASVVSNPKSSTDDVNKVIAERVRLATLLTNTSDYVIDYGSDDGASLAGMDKEIDRARKFLEDFHAKSQNVINEIKKDFNGLVNNINDDIKNVMSGSFDNISDYDKLSTKLEELVNLYKELDKIEGRDPNYKTLSNKASDIQAEIIALGKLKDNAEDIEDVFYGLQDSDKGPETIKDAFSQLAGMLGIEIPKNAQRTESAFDQVGKHIIEATEYVQGLEAAIRNMFSEASKISNIEYKILVNGQEIDARGGANGEVPLKTTMESYLANLTKDTDIEIHSHQGKSANIDYPDLKQAYNRQSNGLTRLSAIVSDKDILTLDLAKVKVEDAEKAFAKVKETIDESSLNTIQPEQLNKIFADINPDYANIAQRWDPSKFGELAQYVYDVKENFSSAVVPLEKFKDLLMSVTGGKIDFSKYAEDLNNFSVDNAGNIFNKIMQSEGIKEDGKILQVDDILQGSLDNVIQDIQRQKDEFLELRQTAKLTYEDIRAEVEKYLSADKVDESFFNKFYHPEEMKRVRDDLADAAANVLDIDSLTNKIAGDFGAEQKELDLIRQTSDAHKENADAIQEEINAEKQLDNAKDNNESNAAEIKEEASAHEHNEDVINEENEALKKQKELYEYIEKINKENRKVSETQLGVTDAKDYVWDAKNRDFADMQMLDVVKEKQKILKQHLSELVRIEAQEKENGQLTEKEIARRKELVGLIRDLQLSVRYKDGTNYSTSEFDSSWNADLSDEIKQLNEVVNLRKKIDLGYYGTGNYGTTADTYNGINISELLDAGSQSFSWDIQEFDQSMIGQLVREYQYLHEEMLRCLRVGEEVPASTLDRLKWFESLDSSKLDEVIPKLTELRDKIDVFTNWKTGTIDEIRTFEYDQDESYYNEKISSLQELLALKKEYISLGGVHDDQDERWDVENIQFTLDRMIELKNGVKDVQRLKSEFSNAHPDINFRSESEYVGILESLQKGTYSYDQALKEITKAYEKHNEEARKAEEALRQQEAAQESLNQEKKQAQDYTDDTAAKAKANADATEQEATAHRENADAAKEESAALDKLNQEKKEETDVNTSEEINQLEKFKTALKEVKEAVELKTEAFKVEGDIVGNVVRQEIMALDSLSSYLDTIYIVINSIVDGLNKVNNTKLNGIDIDSGSASDDKEYALNTTLLDTNKILGNILTAIRGDNNDNTSKLVTELSGAVVELKNVANGIVDRQKIISTDASDRINTEDKRAYLSGIAAQAVSADNLDNVSIEKIYAAADGLVAVTGATKNAEGIWEGFSLSINDANKAVSVSTGKQTLYAKQLNEAADAAEKAASETAKNTTKTQAAANSNITNIQDKYIGLSYRASEYKQDNESSILYSKVTKTTEQYTKALNELKNAKIALDKAPNDEDLRVAFVKAKTDCQNLGNELKGLLDDYDKFKQKHTNVKDIDAGKYNLDSLEDRKQALQEYVQRMYGAEAKTKDFNQECTELNFTLKNSDGTISNMSASFDKLKTSIGSAAAKADKFESAFSGFIGGVSKEMGKLLRYFTARFGIDEFFQAFRTGVQYVRDIDSALTELKKVTSETDATYERFLQTASKTAGVVGSTVAELTQMSAEWARLGYSMQESANLAESTAVLLNVSEFEDATTASEALISTIQAFGYAADDSMHVVDILNEVGNNFAVSSDGIATALQDSASALMAGGNSMEEATAMIAAANKVVQDPNQVGSGLRTISLRLRGTEVSKELEAIGEDIDGLVSSSKMREKILGLSGVDILTDTGSYKSTYQIITEIAKVWGEMNDMDQAALLELMAGKNRSNIMAAMLGNLKDLEGAYKTASDAEGSALRENEAYLDSIQGRVDLFTNSLQTMWMNLIDSDIAKGVVDTGTVLIKFLDTLPGKITAVVAAFAIYKRATSKITFKDMFSGFKNTSGQVISSIKSITTATKELSVSSIELALNNQKVNDGKIADILTTAKLTDVTGKLNKDQIQSAATALNAAKSAGDLTTAQYLAAMSTMGLKTALQGLWNVLKANPVYLIAAGVTAAALAFDALNTTAREAADSTKEAFDEINSVVESTESTVQSLESELSTIQDRIDELNGKTLSFAEEQELEKLKAQRGELEHSLNVQEQLLELQKKSQAEQAVASMKAYTKAASQGAEETENAWKKALTAVGAVVGVAGAAFLTGGISLVPTIAGVAAGGIAGNKAGEWAGSKATQNAGTYDAWYETYTKALETSRKEEQKALENYKKDSSNIDKLDKWQEAQQKTIDIETEMYDHLSQMSQYYNELEYGMSDEIDKELDTWYNFLDKMSIDQGASGAKVSALDRIFGENASDEIKKFKKEINEALEDEDAKIDIAAEIEGRDELQELENQLAEIGITTDEVSDYFRQVGAEGAEAFSDLSGEITAAEVAVTKLQAALDNNTNQGYETRNTAIEEMKHLMEEGLIGSESNLWNIAEAMGFTYDSAKSIEANADALYDYIEVRDAWYQVDEDGNWGTEGADAFAEAIENAIENSEKLQNMDIEWDFDESTGELNFDFNNMQFDEIVTALGETKEAAGLTNEEFIDMLTHLGQFYDIQWANGNDVASYLEYLSTTGLSAKEQLDAVQGPLDQLLKKQGLNSDEIEAYLTGNGSLKELPQDLQEAVGAYRDLHDEMEKETDKDKSDDIQKSDKTSVVSDPVEDWLKNTLPNITNDISDFFTKDIPKFADDIWKDIEEFFLTTLPEEWDEFWDNVGEFFDDVGNYASELWDSVVNFFTDTVPKEWDEFWDDVGEFIFETMPRALGYLWESVVIFFNETLPHAWDDFWDEMDKIGEKISNFASEVVGSLDKFFSETLPKTVDMIGENIGIFFQETLPKFFKQLFDSISEYISSTIAPAWNSFWESVGNFITVTIPQAASELRDQIVHFFTSTLPEAASQLWGEIATFVTETIPGAIDVIGEGIGTFFQETLPNTLSELWTNIIEKLKTGINEWRENFQWGRGNKQEENDKKNNGGKSSGRSSDDPRVSIDINRVKQELNAIDELTKEDRQIVIDAVTKYKDGGNIDDLISDVNAIENEEVRKKVIIELEEEGAFNELFTDLNWLEKNIVIRAITKGKGDVDELNRIIDSLPEDVQPQVRALVDDAMKDLKIVDGKLQEVDNTEATPDVSVPGADKAAKDADNVTDSVNNIPSSKNIYISAPGATGAKKDVDDLDDSVDNLSSTKTVTIWAQIRKKASDLWDKITGGTVGVDGTAHAWGTAHANGTAYAGGNWGAPRTETALTGELGPELLVRDGRWTTIGENGAEFTQIKKGDIIFNHRQTEELLKNGYVTSGGGRGKAYAEGTAYAGGGGWTKTYTFTNDSVKKQNKSKKSSSSKNSSKDTTDAFEEVFDWFEVKIEEINEDLDLMSAKLENAVSSVGKNNILDDIIATNKDKLKTLEKGLTLYNGYASDLLYKIPKAYRDEAKNGKIAIEEFYGEVDEETLEAIKNYREWTQKAAELKVQMQEVKKAIAEAAKQKFDNIDSKYDDITDLQSNRQQHYLDAADYRDDKGWINSGKYYEAAIKEENNKLAELEEEKGRLQASLDEAVKHGDIDKYDDDWYDMVNGIHAVDAQIDECNSNIEDFQNQINEIHFENFEKGLYRVSRISEETKNLIGAMSDMEDIDVSVDGDVEWTDAGITKMGLYAQNMENYKKQAELYAEEIDYTYQLYKDNAISYQEYMERVDDLESKQYDAIQGYEDSKDAIIDLEKARVDAIKEGIQKEIDAYGELIDKKKEELNAEKDLYDFQKSVMEQKKSISDIDRQIAALAGDNSASARAQRKKLEAERAQAQKELDDSYYDRSVQNQQEALDTELELFTELREKEMEGWDKWLENVDAVFEDAMETVQSSGTIIKDTIEDVANEWDLQISNKLIDPWDDASTAMEKTSEILDEIIVKFNEVVDSANETAEKQINKQKEDNDKITAQNRFDKGQKVTAKKGTQVYTSSGKKDWKVGYDSDYTVVSVDNTTGLTKVKNPDGKIRYFKTSDLENASTSSSSKSSSSGSSSSSSSSKKNYPYGKASDTSGNIGYGATGNKVKAIQYALDELGYSVGDIDGSFGPKTRDAVKAFQKKRGITVDGIVGDNTRKKFKLMGYAVGSKGIDKDQWALLDELGEELQIVPNSQGRLDYIKKGTGIIPADMTERLMDIAMNPQDMLDRNRPTIGVSPEIHNTEINLNIQYGDMLKIENFKGDNPDEIAKIVAKQFEKHTAQLNQSLRKYVR